MISRYGPVSDALAFSFRGRQLVRTGISSQEDTGSELTSLLAQEFARSGIEVLVEVVDELKKRKLFPNPNFEIYVDGGVRRATDVLKAVALGATAVGIGR